MSSGPGLLLKTVVELDLPNPNHIKVGLPEGAQLLRTGEEAAEAYGKEIRLDVLLRGNKSDVKLEAGLHCGMYFMSPRKGQIFVDDAPFGFTADPRCMDTVLSIKRMTKEGYGQLLLSYNITRLMELLPDGELGLGMDMCANYSKKLEVMLIPETVCRRLGIKEGEPLALSRSPPNRLIESLTQSDVPEFISHMRLP